MAEKKTSGTKSTGKTSKTTRKSTSSRAQSKGTSSNKTNVNRVAKSAKKYDTNKSVADNSDAILGMAAATATSARRSKSKGMRTFFAVLCILLIVAVVGIAVFGYVSGWFDKYLNHDPNAGGTGGNNGGTTQPTVVSGELSIHFLELGNNYTGDCVYIKAGTTDILIDAGSRQNSAPAIEQYVDRYCDDNKLEYVIVTHAHQDHIAGFVSTTTTQGIFDKYECETVITFARTNATSQIYSKFCDALQAEVDDGGTNNFTALQCWNETDGAKRKYDLTGDGAITMEILYQRYYEENTSDENDYSVCVLFRQGSNSYLFTGDLEEKGEASLVAKNNLPQVELFKGGHHGSYTASTDTLLSVIKPKRVCVCCCAGSVEYTQNPENTFPSQAFVNRVSKYTDQVYVTTLGKVDFDEDKNKYVDVGFQSFNGTIVVTCTNGVIEIKCSNNDLKLKDTQWFRENRTMPSYWTE